MIYNVQKMIVGALPLALSTIGLLAVADLITIKASVRLGVTFILFSWVVGHLMTIWTNWYRDLKHRRGI